MPAQRSNRKNRVYRRHAQVAKPIAVPFDNDKTLRLIDNLPPQQIADGIDNPLVLEFFHGCSFF